MRSVICSVAFILAGCTAMFVSATFNPGEKLLQSEVLLDEGRFLPAERLIHEAMDIYTKSDDEIGMAEAYNALGNFYKHHVYHDAAEFYKKQKTYDGTYMKSIENFSKGRDLFEKHENYLGVSKCIFGIGNAYGLRGEKEKECNAYNESLDYYHKAKLKDPNISMRNRMNSIDYDELIKRFREKAGCTN